MKCALLAFTARGSETAARISAALRENGCETETFVTGRDFESVRAIVGRIFPIFDVLVFVGACGIAVRTIAPHIKSKATDPAVIVCDELGKHAIPILSGHIGGANEMAVDIAAALGGEAVLTTATDINGVFAADLWAKKNGLVIRNLGIVKLVSSRILNGEPVGFVSEYDYEGELPPGVSEGDHKCGIYVGADDKRKPFQITLSMAPKNLVLGIGCRRGAPLEKIEEAISFAGVEIERVTKLCSIDIKANEPGLLEFARKRGLETEFFSAESLMSLEGEFSSSDYVRSATGADNVCERAAALGGGKGKLVVRKKSLNGVTVAVFEKYVSLRF